MYRVIATIDTEEDILDVKDELIDGTEIFPKKLIC